MDNIHAGFLFPSCRCFYSSVYETCAMRGCIYKVFLDLLSRMKPEGLKSLFYFFLVEKQLLIPIARPAIRDTLKLNA